MEPSLSLTQEKRGRPSQHVDHTPPTLPLYTFITECENDESSFKLFKGLTSTDILGVSGQSRGIDLVEGFGKITAAPLSSLWRLLS